MTVESTITRQTHACNGTVGPFTFSFKIYAVTDIKCYLRTIATGAEVLLTQDTDYEVTIATDPELPYDGGTVTFIGSYETSPPTSDYQLVIIRDIPATQLIHFVPGGNMPAESLEEGYDRAAMLIQQLLEKFNRAILLSASSPSSGLTVPEPEALKFLRWNALATALENLDISAQGNLAVSDFMKTVLDDLTAAAARATLGVEIGADVQAYDADTTKNDVMNEFTASQKLKGDALLWRFLDTGASGKEWGIRSDGGNIEICENTGTEAAPTWTLRATINATGFSGDGSQLTGLSNPGIMGIYRNLVIVPPSTSTVGINADEILLQNTDGVTKRFAPVDLTVDITTSGANGLDTGSEAASTWYAIWVIGKSDGTVAGLLSTSPTAPTMPSGYTFKAFVGWARNNDSSNFGSFNQYGNITRLLNPGTALNNVASQTTVEADISAIVPPGINGVFGTLICLCSDGWFYINDVTFPDNIGIGNICEPCGYQVYGASPGIFLPFSLNLMRTDQKIYYQSQGEDAYFSLLISGFILR